MTPDAHTRYVTPTLYLGTPRLSGVQQATSAVQAVAIIETGGIAALPPNAFEEAASTLRALGVSRSVRRSRMHFAKTGSLLPPPG